jgi:hypothetical protein
MNNLFKAAVLATLISFCDTNAFAVDTEPTVSDAQELIRGMVEKNMFNKTTGYSGGV